MAYRTLRSDSVTIHVTAPAERVYDLIADVTQMGRWSPECFSCEWLNGDNGPRVGARFKARNKRGILRWSNSPRVIAAHRGHEFAFTRTGFGAGEYVWRYRMAMGPDGGTELTESYEAIRSENPIISRLVSLFTPGTEADYLNGAMRRTLDRIREAAEQPDHT